MELVNLAFNAKARGYTEARLAEGHHDWATASLGHQWASKTWWQHRVGRKLLRGFEALEKQFARVPAWMKLRLYFTEAKLHLEG